MEWATGMLLRPLRRGEGGPRMKLTHPGADSRAFAQGRSRDGGADLSCGVVEGS